MVIVIMGVCGCGKTTVGQLLAATMDWSFLDADDFHPPANVEKMSRGEPLTDEDREPWLRRLAELIAEHTDAGRDAVVGCSALTIAARDTLAEDDPLVRFVYLKGDRELIRQRMRDRIGHFMPPDLVDSQFDALQEPHDAVVVDIAQPPEMIVAAIRDRLNV